MSMSMTTTTTTTTTTTDHQVQSSLSFDTNTLQKGKEKASGPIRTYKTPNHRLKKLDPPRPFPTIPAGASASGPRSAHREGKNYITITRKTKLGAYLRRCKDIILKDGYKSLHLSALGAAIPHLCTLAASLPDILPFPAEEIRTEVLTGTVDVQDELLPDDEDEDISYRTRSKSSLSIVIIIGDGVDESIAGGSKWGPRGKRRKRTTFVSSLRTEDGGGTQEEDGGEADTDES
ncbi:hypothetical protein B0F90DRAFT_1711602 [Multifurca ochricompacta]|uniref:Uncharacterized protein n=1 Tax=Multifurca ochricompacta TaxID=376703 RepID=A0AAD4M6E7_9AGAM|nr:hypothetical protein B0F90DRAFT_1711602 [Multifurca ochricompacta]